MGVFPSKSLKCSMKPWTITKWKFLTTFTDNLQQIFKVAFVIVQLTKIEVFLILFGSGGEFNNRKCFLYKFFQVSY